MKKKIFSVLIFLFVTTLSFSQENEKIIDYLRENNSIWADFEEVNGLKYYDKFCLYEKTYFVIGYDGWLYEGYITDGETYCYKDPFPFVKTKHKGKYQWQDGLLSFFDYDFDTKKDFLFSYITIPYVVGIEIISPYNDCKSILTVELDGYDVDEYQLDWIEYCILNGKRGIRIRCRGKVHEGDYCYVADGGIDQYAFFYWSPSEQRYILDESVTQTQIKNAYCPEEYFAYSGLDFSKLDKSLKKSDVKDLTPAQLRLMRNAIYARHGQKFTSVDLQSLWECYTWYKPNPGYTDSMLTKTDKKNLKLIQDMEKVTGTYVPDLPR
ncbi:MAG: YARHG domain-containing protein [Treponema sp.]|nr:YARHG domain-containing protein [Treponema sp.]